MNRRELVLALAGALTAARTLRAQQKAMPVIGFLGTGSANALLLAAFRQGLSEAGYIEGQNLAIGYRWDHQLKPGLHEVERHRPAHIAQADKSHAARHRLPPQ
jgi:hypothetical protein